eukprot:TRINITY_DN11688_c0_g1_i1.p1 TRINITY_DN11688_c0_g1~~TRINITY_DN11688_c0_g1_i1.p1  ORF type:complete len:405 (-),score=71.97 TRINITY_DN11688_c0_g1_i1:1200-2384(-)
MAEGRRSCVMGSHKLAKSITALDKFTVAPVLTLNAASNATTTTSSGSNTTLLLLSDGTFLSGYSCDFTIKHWSSDGHKLLRVFSWGSCNTSYIRFNNLFFLAQTDSLTGEEEPPTAFLSLAAADSGSIKVWSLITGMVINKFNIGSNHINTVMKLRSRRNTYICCVNNTTIEVWILSETITTCLSSKTQAHECTIWFIKELEFEPGVIATSCSLAFKLWHLKDSNLLPLRTIKAASITVLGHLHDLVEIEKGVIATCYTDMSIKVWDLESWSLKRTLLGHSDVVKKLTSVGHHQMLFSGSDDNTVKVWNVKSGMCLRTLQVSSGKVNSIVKLKQMTSQIAIGTSSGVIEIWDFSSKLVDLCCATLARYVTHCESLKPFLPEYVYELFVFYHQFN